MRASCFSPKWPPRLISLNTFSGYEAGNSNTTGAGNTFLGASAGEYNTTGSNNVYIADAGPTSGTESNAIRIGFGEAAAYIGGIYGSTSSGGIPVLKDEIRAGPNHTEQAAEEMPKQHNHPRNLTE